MRRILISAVLMMSVAAFLLVATGAGNSSPLGTYKIEVDNAFGLVTNADFKVAGVKAGSIKSIDLDTKTLHAVVTVQVTQPGFAQFHSDVTCDTRPQSLIGEYFIECLPGRSGSILPSGSTIPASHTTTTIAPDLLADIMRVPYRQRFSLILGELGAAVAGRSEDLQTALMRAVPALRETDNLLSLLGDDSQTLQALTLDSDRVITALANNSANVQKFVVEAGKTATLTAQRSADFKATLHKLPPFLEQLRPALAQLDAATANNTPALVNLNAASAQFSRLLGDLPGFSRASLPALKSLGQASVTGSAAVKAAGPTVKDLNTFAKPAPELANNLGIVLNALDDRSRAVEKDPRSPGGLGYTGLEALLQYVYNQTLAINYFGPFGHVLAVDGFIDPRCVAFADKATVATNLKTFGAAYRQCYAWLGPNQPGVNETDPSDPTAAVPDPGGAPPGYNGPVTSAAKLVIGDNSKPVTQNSKTATKPNTVAKTNPVTTAPTKQNPITSPITKTTTGAVNAVKQALSKLLGGVLGGSNSSSSSTNNALTGLTNLLTGGKGSLLGALGSGSSGGSSNGDANSSNAAQQLLNYLLSP